METDDISEAELWQDLLGDLGDEPEPACTEGWHSFEYLSKLARHLSSDQLRDRLEASVKEGTREKVMWQKRAYYRKI